MTINIVQNLIPDLKKIQENLVEDIKTTIDNLLKEKKEKILLEHLLKQKLISKEQFVDQNLFDSYHYFSFLKNYSYFVLNRILFAKVVEDKKGKEFNLSIEEIKKIISEPIICFVNQSKNDIILFPNDENLLLIVEKLNTYNLSSMDGENLGYLYEYFLPKEDKKRLGAYYTEAWIIDYIISELNLSRSSLILEPSCGTGAFLSHTYNYLKTLGLSHNEIIQNLYGIEINPYVVEISLMTLYLKDIENTNKDKNMNLFVLNTLKPFEEQPELVSQNYNNIFNIPHKFDAILGNPPYGIKFSKEDKKIFLKEFKDTWFMKYDSFACFIHYAINKLNDKGRLGFIIPSTFLSIDTFQFLRKYILEHCKIASITDLGKGIFDQATVSTIILVLERCDNEKERQTNQIKFVNLSHLNTREEKSNNLKNQDYITQVAQSTLHKDNEKHQLLFKPLFYNRMLEKTIPLKLLCDIKIAARSTEFTDDPKNNKLILSLDNPTKRSKLLLKGKNNHKWNIDNKTNYTSKYIPNNALEKIKGGIYLKDKIVISHTQGNSVVASLDLEQNPWTGDVFIVTLLNSTTHYLLEYILGIINSEYIQKYHRSLYRDTTPHLIKTAVENFPIPYTTIDKQQEIRQYVLNIISNTEKDKNIILLNQVVEAVFANI